MIRKYTYLMLMLLLSVSVLFTSCGKDEEEEAPAPAPAPVAGFTFSPQDPTPGQQVNFANSSTNAETFEWAFGDGATSTDRNPVHTYEAAGEYAVTLKAIGAGGENTFTATVVVATASAPAPVADFTFTPDPAQVGQSIRFNSTSQNAVSFEWDFAGQGSATGETADFTFNEPGRYNVTLTVANSAGATDSKTLAVTVEEATRTAILLGVVVEEIPFGPDQPVFNAVVFLDDVDENPVFQPRFLFPMQAADGELEGPAPLPAAYPFEASNADGSAVTQNVRWTALNEGLILFLLHYDTDAGAFDTENYPFYISEQPFAISDYIVEGQDLPTEIALPEQNGFKLTLVLEWE
ncbi:MAG: PKD domain-containing protein [Bernardetiaceae bacterium]|nr:PKD domain-containing protein [Bernardetiaceae bacterium]